MFIFAFLIALIHYVSVVVAAHVKYRNELAIGVIEIDSSLFFQFLLIGISHLVLLYIFDVFEPQISRWTKIGRLLSTTFTTFSVYSFIALALRPPLMARSLLVTSVVSQVLAGLVVTEFYERLLSRKKVKGVLIVAEKEEIDQISECLMIPTRRGFICTEQILLKGIFDPTRALIPEENLEGIGIIALTERTTHTLNTKEISSLIENYEVSILSISDYFRLSREALPLSFLSPIQMISSMRSHRNVTYGRIKRICDISAGLTLLFLALIVSPFVLIGNLFWNKGPLFFRQLRIGQFDKQFELIKFRTMIGDDNISWTADNDPRVTPFGRFLRKSHIDELPQSINLIRGDLSLVGPRPEQPIYVAKLSGEIPFYDLRHLVKPGLTSWGQVQVGYGGSKKDAEIKLSYDLFGLSSESPIFDLRVVMRSIRSVFLSRGR